MFVLASVSGSSILVPAMEWLDGRFDGIPVRHLDEAFGGSLLLGVMTTVICASAVAVLIYALVRWLIGYRDTIATILETLLMVEQPQTLALVSRRGAGRRVRD